MKVASLLLACVVALSISVKAQATVLSFVNATGGVTAVNPSYGDNVATLPTSGGFTYGNDGHPTPNVALSYVNTDWITTNGQSVTFPDGAQTAGNTWTYTITADPGFDVSLGSLQYAFLGTPTTFPTIGYTVTDGATTLASGSFVDNAPFSGPLGTQLLGGTADTLTLTLMVTTARVGGGGDGIGITNISFTQTALPEPSSCLLMGLGTLASGLYIVRRRRK